MIKKIDEKDIFEFTENGTKHIEEFVEVDRIKRRVGGRAGRVRIREREWG